jgi:hypothetical protein
MTNATAQFAAPAMPSDEDIDKRAYQRLPRTYPVEAALLTFPMPKDFLGMTCCDISRGGICVETPPVGLVVGDICQVRVLIPLLNKFASGFFKVYENDAEQYFTGLGEILWKKPAAGRELIGFKFVNVHADQLKALEKLIESAFASQ